MRGRRLILSCAMVGIAACAEFVVPTSPERLVRALRMSAQQLTIDDGQTTRLTVTALDQTGQAFSGLPAGTQVVWSSTASDVASVDDTGLIRANRPGTAQIQASVPSPGGPIVVGTAVTVLQVPTALAAAAGDSQTAAVATRLPQDLRVKVTDRWGTGVPGIAVVFAVTVGRGALTTGAVSTDSTGQASAGLILDTLIGSVGVSATAVRLPAALVRFSAAARPGPTTALAKVAGDAQSAVVATQLPVALAVRLADRYGNVAPGVTVGWQVTAGGGALSAPTSVSDSLGRASVTWTLGSTLGAQAVQASVGSTLTASFAATATPIPVATVTVSPDTATVTVGQTRQYTATTKDASGSVLTGRVITWTSSDTAVATVSGTGLATARRAGSATLTATSEGKSGTAMLTAIGGAISTALSVVTVSSPTAAPSGSVVITLQAKDAAGNNLTTGGRTVAFTLTGGTSTGTLGAVTDHGDGTYTATFTAGSMGTALTVGATIDGVAVTSTLPTIQVIALAVTSVPISAGANHACEIRSGGAVYCWGSNAAGQFGNGTATSSGTPVAGPNSPSFATVSAGGDHTCGLTAAGVAYCWGGNALGQLGAGTTAPSTIPVAVSGGIVFAQVLAGDGFACGLAAAGVAYCWGSNGDGKLGVGNAVASSSVPVPVAGGRTFTRLGLWGNNHACGLATGGAAYCWGYNFDGELGDGTQASRSVPTAVVGGLTFTDLVGATYHTCAQVAGGAAYCWGDNNVAQLGYGAGDSWSPGAVQGGYSFTSLVGGYNHTCGLLSDGSAICWGYNYEGALGDGTNVTRTAPAPVSGGLTFTALAAGDNFTCGRTASTGTWCWGRNTVGQLGNTSGAGSFVPVPVGQAAAASITVTTPRDTLQGGETVQAAATVRDGSGNVLAGRIVAWASSDTAAATVNANGVVHVRRRGNPQIQATVQGVSGSVNLVVVPGAAFRLVFTVQPSTVQAGSAIPLVKATAWDSVGNIVDSYVNSVVVTLGTNPGGATLGGTTSAVPSNGVATFTDLTLSAAGTGYTLVASSVGLVSAISTPFTVTPAALPPIALDVPGPDIIAPGGSNLLNIVLPLPAPVGGVTVSVSSDAPGVVNPASASVVFAAGTTTGQIVLNGVSVGSTTVHATGAGYGAGALPVSVISAINAVQADTLSVGTKSACLIRSGQLYCWGNNTYGQLGDSTTVNHGVPTKGALGRTFVAVSVGSTHACGLTADGTAYCWGDNSYGALGAFCYNFCGSQSSTPIAVDGGVLFAKIRAGYQTTCGLTVAGAIYCWGNNGGGQLGVASGGVPGQIGSTLTFGDVAVGGFSGYGFSCGLTTGGAAYCWGDNRFGELGDSSTTSRYIPRPVAGGLAFSQLSSGYEGIPGHSCALTNAGDTWCWGGNLSTALGFSTSNSYLEYPGRVASAPALASVTAAGDLTCGLDAVGAAWCWGKNGSGTLGDGTTTTRANAALVSGGLAFSTLRAGPNSVCGVTTGGELWCWGNNNDGQIGDGTSTERHAPVLVTIPDPVATVTVAPAAPIVPVGTTVQLAATVKDAGGNVLTGRSVTWISSDPTIASVGTNGLVTGVAVGAVTITATSEGVNGTATVTVTTGLSLTSPGTLSAGYQHTCDVRANAALNCWGSNTAYQLGTGNSTEQHTPTPVATALQFFQVAAGYDHSCGLAADSTAYCWGLNGHGQGGNGTTYRSSTPFPVDGGVHFAQIVSGFQNSCARTPAGAVYCWGAEFYSDRLSPVRLSQLPLLATISTTSYHVCGLTASGQGYCWGNASNGQLGDGTYPHNWTSPNAGDSVVGGLNFVSIAAGSNHSCGVAAGGAAYCWGANSTSQLGRTTVGTDDPTPGPVQGGHVFASVYAGTDHSCGLSPDGTAYCWGAGAFGQLGNGGRADALSPVLVAGGLRFAFLTLGVQFTCGRTLAGQTYCWGINDRGQLGTGDTAVWDSPQLVH